MSAHKANFHFWHGADCDRIQSALSEERKFARGITTGYDSYHDVLINGLRPLPLKREGQAIR